MICFVYNTNKKLEGIPNKYPELIQYEMPFRIIVNGRLFFEDEYFPVYEFLWQIREWKSGEDFYYNSIETDDNPILSFQIVPDEKPFYRIISVWQKFYCEDLFSEEELSKAIQALEEGIKCHYD